MENMLIVDFESNRVERTKAEWIQELIQYQLVCLDTASNVEDTITYLLTKGFTGYENFSDIALIDEIYDLLADTKGKL